MYSLCVEKHAAEHATHFYIPIYWERLSLSIKSSEVVWTLQQ